MVIKAMRKAVRPATAKTHQDILILYAKPCSHLSINNHAKGAVIKKEIPTNFKMSSENNLIMVLLEAPKTLRTPISLVRCCAENIANPRRPKAEIAIASKEKTLDSLEINCSLWYKA